MVKHVIGVLNLALLVIIVMTLSIAHAQNNVNVDLAWDAAPDHTTNTTYTIHACESALPADLTCSNNSQTFPFGAGILSGQVSYSTSNTIGTVFFRATATENSVTSVPSNQVSQAFDFSPPGDPAITLMNPIASSNDPPNVEANVLDDDISTRWSAEGANEWVYFDMGMSYDVSEVHITWYDVNQNPGDWTSFDLQVSDDATNWTTFYSDTSQSAGPGNAVGTYVVAGTGRYLRFLGHGTPSHLWNSLLEFDAFGVQTPVSQVNVPNIVGLAQAAADSALVAVGLVSGTVTQANDPGVPVGDVISQNPVVGTLVNVGSAVDYVVSLGPVMVTVPNIVGLAQAAADSTILANNLSVGTVTQANDPVVPVGNVISQNPVAGTSVPEDSFVDYVVSLGPVNNTTVIIVSPLANQEVSGTVIFSVLVDDPDGVANVELQDNATGQRLPGQRFFLQEPSLGPPGDIYSWLYNSALVSGSSLSVQVEVTDNLSNVTVSSPVTMFVFNDLVGSNGIQNMIDTSIQNHESQQHGP